MKMAAPHVLAGVLCFIASCISSAGGVGGGGLFIPILTIISGLDLRTASSLSAFMVTGGSIANVFCNLFATNYKSDGKPLIDYDIALLSEPCMLLGVSAGVICNVVFPEWLITVVFAVFLAWSTLKTCKNGMVYWKMESEELSKNGSVTNLEKDGRNVQGLENFQVPLLGGERECELRFPWKKLGVLILVWFSFYFVYLLRGNSNGQSIVQIEPCGLGYWILSSVQIPLALAFSIWILNQKENSQTQSSNQKGVDEDLAGAEPPKKLIFPVVGLLAGILGGMFGIGGGMLISPILLQFGVVPEVTSATCSFMVFFSSTMSACQYLILGMDHIEMAITLSIICFIASLLGLVVVKKAVTQYGRESPIVFSVSMVMALSTIMMTSFCALDVWRDYISGKYMGFKLPC